MVAKDVMTRRVVTVTTETPVAEIARLLLDRHISAVPVVDADARVLGIVSEGDLMRRPETGAARRRSWWLSLVSGEDAADYVKAHGGRASHVMTRGVVTVTEDTPLPDVARLLEERRIKRVPVLRRGKLVGIVSRADLLRGLATAKLPSRKAKVESDRAIQGRLVKALDRLDWAPKHLLTATVTDGVAHLWGLVDSEDQRSALRVAAEGVPGVRSVEDHMGYVPPYLRS